MHGEATATYCPGKHHFSCLRIPCRRQGRLYHLHNYVIPEQVLSSLPRILLRVSRHGHISHQLDPPSQLFAWKASLWRRTRDQLSSLGMFLVAYLLQETILWRPKHAFCTLTAHALAHLQEPVGFLPSRLDAIIYHTLLAVCSCKRAQALPAFLAHLRVLVPALNALAIGRVAYALYSGSKATSPAVVHIPTPR